MATIQDKKKAKTRASAGSRPDQRLKVRARLTERHRIVRRHDPGEYAPMCNRYVSPDQAAIERFWHIGGRNPPRWWAPEVYPRAQGPFIRAANDGPELAVGQWGLIPFFAKAANLPYSTNNARSEELAAKPTFRDPWKRGQRCIVPAVSFDEPCWETGKNVWWRFRRADGALWGLAGLWNTWLDKATGELVESYTMLTLNADAHPLMRRMHKPEPNLPPDAQDKRSVLPIDAGDVEQWLRGTVDEAQSLLRLAPVETFDAGPFRRRRSPRCCSSLQLQPTVSKPLSCKEVVLGALHGRQRKTEKRESSESLTARTGHARVRRAMPRNAANTRGTAKKKPQPRTVGVSILVGRRQSHIGRSAA